MVNVIIMNRRHADYLYANGCRQHSKSIMLMWVLKAAITSEPRPVSPPPTHLVI
jgi:hypothetical protein